MKLRQHSLKLLLVMGLFLTMAATVWGQEPAWPPTRGQPTPTSHSSEPPLEPQIVGGQPADPAEYPWQVAIVEATEPNPLFGQFCGGSLIASEWILTAAHCVVDFGLMTDPADINVVLGINNLSDGPTSGTQGQRLAVDEIIPFPGYNYYTNDGDVALLHLAAPAALGPTVNTIGVAGSGDSSLFEPGDTATVTGWGATFEGGPGSNALLEVALPIVSNAICNAPISYDGAVTANMLCAGLAAGGIDSCLGDSGSPLIVPTGSGGWVQVGAVSWGIGCARPNFYGVYARVSQFKGWIDLQLNGPSAIYYFPLVMKASQAINPQGATPPPLCRTK